MVDDATLGIIACPQDTLAVGETFKCSITERLTNEGAVFMEAQARGSYLSELVRDDDPINFTVAVVNACIAVDYASGIVYAREAAGFVIARRANRRLQLDNELSTILDQAQHQELQN